LLYRVTGRGTSILAQKKAGACVNLMGPLGRGFTLPERALTEELGEKGEKDLDTRFAKKLKNKGCIAVVAGGIGIAPLFFLLQELSLREIPINVFFGARSREELYLLEDIKNMGFCVHIATDDGSFGCKGTVVSLLEEKLKKGSHARPAFKPAFVYGCGPRPMLSALARLLNGLGIPGEISLEERMGCGVGACLSCVCKARGKFSYWRVCTEGPVFSVAEVVVD